MKKIITLLVAIATLVIAVALIAPWWVGQQIEQRFKNDLAAFSTPDMAITLDDYQRGWFSSTATTRLTLTVDGERVPLLIHHDIRHGPRPFGWARIESRPDPEPIRPLIEHFFADRTALAGTTRIGFGGTVHSEWRSDAFPATAIPYRSSERDTLAWGGMSLVMTIDGDHAEAQLELPLLRLEEAGARIALEGLEVHSSGPFSADWPGGDDFWQGGGDFQLTTFEISNPREDTTLNFSVQGSSHLIDNDDNGLALESELQLNDLEFLGYRMSRPLLVDSAELQLAVEGLPRRETRQLIHDLQQLSPALDDSLMMARTDALLRQYQLSLLEASPKMMLRIDNFESPAGSLQGEYNAALEAPGESSSTTPDALLSRLRLALSLSADRTLLSRMIAAVAPALPAAALLDGLERQGLIAGDGERYRLDARLGAGTLTINGEPRPEMLMLLLPRQGAW